MGSSGLILSDIDMILLPLTLDPFNYGKLFSVLSNLVDLSAGLSPSVFESSDLRSAKHVRYDILVSYPNLFKSNIVGFLGLNFWKGL